MLREIVMPLVAVQTDCPLQFERVERLMNVDGGGANIYRLMNRGSKPITSFTISYLFPNGNGGSSGWPKAGSRLVGPGEYVRTESKDRLRDPATQRRLEGQAGSSRPDEGIRHLFYRIS